MEVNKISQNKIEQKIYEQRCFTFLKEYFGNNFNNFEPQDFPDY